MNDSEEERVTRRVNLNENIYFGGRNLFHDDLRKRGWVDETYRPKESFDVKASLEQSDSKEQYVIWTATKRNIKL